MSRVAPLLVMLAIVLSPAAGCLAVQPATRPTTAPMPDARLANELKRIDQEVSRIDDLQADFEQVKRTPLLKKPLISGGEVLIKGSRTLWKTSRPEPSIMSIASDEIRIYYPRQKVMEVYPVAGQLGALAASPLPRLSLLEKFFRFRRIAPDQLAASDRSFLAIELTPIDKTLAEHVMKVRVLIDRRTGLIRQATTFDPAGDQTTLSFSNIRVNTGLKESQLQLTPPEGTTISHPLEGASR